MTNDVDLVGIFVPALLVLMLLAYGINLALRAVFARLGVYRFVWHRSIFDLGIYVITVGALVLITQ